MKRGFTLIELVVAVGLLAMMLVFAGSIFKVSIGSQRTAGANADVMRKFRAITDQLNADFKGLRKDAPLLISFQRDPNTGERFDEIMFFADGDFQSTQTYDFGKTPVVPSFPPIAGLQRPLASNVARIYYGQARVYSVTAGLLYPWQQSGINEHDRMLNTRNRTLARRQHLLTAEPMLSPFPNPDPAMFQASFFAGPNNDFEHDAISLSQWQALTLTSATPANCDKVLDTCFNYRPPINLLNGTRLYMLMAQGVSSFAVQWAYYSPVFNRYLWYPSADPDQDGYFPDSDFTTMTRDAFGVYFNITAPTLIDWFAPNQASGGYFTGTAGFFPKALKFTFTLHDSKGVLNRPQTFTHIVYLDN